MKTALDELTECAGLPINTALQLIREFYKEINQELGQLHYFLTNEMPDDALKITRQIKKTSVTLHLHRLTSDVLNLEAAIKAKDKLHTAKFMKELTARIDQYRGDYEIL